MTRVDWLIRVMMWDGVLPAIVAGVPWLMRWLFPGNLGLVAVIMAIFPLVAALIRCTIAQWQLSRLFPSRVPLLRQVIFAGAIISLLLFELTVNVLALAQGEPLAAWLVPLGCYAVYLLLICGALRPAPETNWDEQTSIGLSAVSGESAWEMSCE